MPAMMVIAKPLATISATWSDISVVSPATQANNEDRTITWAGGGSRTVTTNWASGGTLAYRIDGGSWTTYTQGGAGFALSSGQTLAWRLTSSSNINVGSSVVSVGGIIIDTFTMQASGFP